MPTAEVEVLREIRDAILAVAQELANLHATLKQVIGPVAIRIEQRLE